MGNPIPKIEIKWNPKIAKNAATKLAEAPDATHSQSAFLSKLEDDAWDEDFDSTADALLKSS